MKTTTQLWDSCDLWNFRYPVGAQVEYHPVIGESSLCDMRESRLIRRPRRGSINVSDSATHVHRVDIWRL